MITRTKLKIFPLWSIIIIFLACCEEFPTPKVWDEKEVAELEEYLIDFSKKIEGYRLVTGRLPSDLDAEKFFSILEQYYPDKEIIQRVKSYPVRILLEGDSYVLILCDQKLKILLYKDLGSTITVVDFPYWREGKKIPCSE